ncbi:MAG: sulfatase [Myxococcota bacterium]
MPRQSPATILIAACFWSSCTLGSTPRATPTDQPEAGIAVDHVPFLSLSLPRDNRDGTPPPRRVAISKWERVASNNALRFKAILPVRPRARHFFRPPPSMTVLDETLRPLPFSREASSRRSWTLDATSLTLTDRTGQDREPGTLFLIDPSAQARESSLNLAFSGNSDPDAFVQARMQIGDDTHEGLFLPAPATAKVEVTIPTAGELHFTPILVPPEFRDLAPGDGADLRIRLLEGGKDTVIWTGSVVEEGAAPSVIVDLSTWAGRTVQLAFETLSKANSRYDYVLFGGPTIASRSRRPKRIVMLFVDTLRPDHLPAYGYERNTAPYLTALAGRGLVATRARSVAPWTLPSARSALSGARPADYNRGPTLAETLRSNGWHTSFYATNMFLSDRYGMTRGFSDHTMDLQVGASKQVDRGIAWLDTHTDRDGLLVLHFMDPHLPYTEPPALRSTFAGPTPRGWKDEFSRSTVLKKAKSPAVRTWIQDRYDNNILHVDQQLERLSKHLRPDDLVVVFSDHGEEFWDHGAFEHGHSLYEEVVRVPLIVAGPGIPATRLESNVSLMDIAPTVLQWAQVPAPPHTIGQSLLPQDDGGKATSNLNLRDLPLGHPLYGMERWGVVTGARKFHSHAGREMVHDLSTDPNELADILAEDGRAEWHARLSAAHGGATAGPLRVVVNTLRDRSSEAVDITLHGASPFTAVWLGQDAMGVPGLSAERLEDGSVRIQAPARWQGQREVFALPASGMDSAPLLVAVKQGMDPRPAVYPVDLGQRPAPDGLRDPLMSHVWSRGTSVSLSWSLVVQPRADDTPSSGYDPELLGALKNAGYLSEGAD